MKHFLVMPTQSCLWIQVQNVPGRCIKHRNDPRRICRNNAICNRGKDVVLVLFVFVGLLHRLSEVSEEASIISLCLGTKRSPVVRRSMYTAPIHLSRTMSGAHIRERMPYSAMLCVGS